MTGKRRFFILLIPLLGLLLIAGFVLAQSTSTNPLTPIRTLGQPRPQGIQYNQPNDQFVWVAPGGILQIIDARTYRVQHTLYTGQTYNAYSFSDDGMFFAVALNRRVDLWNPRSGELLETFEPEGILDIQGPLQFADDNGLLVVNSVVPAPQEIRRSENDTTILPWLWDIPAALGTAPSQLPGQATALPFFDYRNGFIMGNQDKVVAARPGRLEVLDVGTRQRNVILSEIDSDRFERDPVDAWRSQTSDAVYVRPIGRSLTQIRTSDGAPLPLPDGTTIGLVRDATNNQTYYERILMTGSVQSIGELISTDYNSLTGLLLGESYRINNGFAPLRVYLVDVLDPITPTAAPNQIITYTFNEETEVGTFRYGTPEGVMKTALNPQRTQIAFYFASGEIFVYNIATGDIVRRLEVTYPDRDGRAIFSYDPTGEHLIYDFQRFDVSSGRVILQDLNIRRGFTSFFFAADNRTINTIDTDPNGRLNWWQWDIETGEIIRQETVQINGSLLDTTADRSRYLTQIDRVIQGESRTGLEIHNVLTGERTTLLFDNFPNTSLLDVFPSPDWQHAVVLYAYDDGFTRYADLALYSFENGLAWYISGANIPGGGGADLYWTDNDTLVLPLFNTALPLTVSQFGLDYHPTGLPECLVQAFPADYERWLPLWERRVTYLGELELIDLTRRVCDAIPTDTVAMDNIITTPTPTPIPTRETTTTYRATPPALAYVPTCITQQFQADAEEYAEVWRSISEGLSLEAIAELETIICEGLGATGGGSGGFGGDVATPRLLIDITTQERELTYSIVPPYSRPAPYQTRLVVTAYERATGSTLLDAQLSSDGRFIAHTITGGYIQIDRLSRPYQELAAAATATQNVFASQTPNIPRISLQPTATPTSESLGLPLPTLTPTITPTSPPRTESGLALPRLGETVDFCDANAVLHTLDNPPTDFAPPGVLYTVVNNNSTAFRLDPRTGETYGDLTIPECYLNGNCRPSFDGAWLLDIERGDAVVYRADGTDRRVIIERFEEPYFIEQYFWRDANDNLVQLGYNAPPDPAQPFEMIFYTRLYDPVTDTLTAPTPQATPRPFEDINELPTEIVSRQPISDRFWIARTPFDTGRGTGYKYYLVDRETDEVTYFARLGEFESSNSIEFRWEQFGRLLYYRFPADNQWYAFDPTDATFKQYGQRLPNGNWSRDASFVYGWQRPDPVEFAERQADGLLNPHLTVFEMETGLTRRYCIPQRDEMSFNAPLVLSPDNRYLAFTMQLPERFFDTRPTAIPRTTPTPFYGLPDSEPERLSGVNRTYLLDLQTGSVTEIGQGQQNIIAWITEGGES